MHYGGVFGGGGVVESYVLSLAYSAAGLAACRIVGQQLKYASNIVNRYDSMSGTLWHIVRALERRTKVHRALKMRYLNQIVRVRSGYIRSKSNNLNKKHVALGLEFRDSGQNIYIYFLLNQSGPQLLTLPFPPLIPVLPFLHNKRIQPPPRLCRITNIQLLHLLRPNNHNSEIRSRNRIV